MTRGETMRLLKYKRTVTGMAEYIEKWSIVNRLIDIENELQQYKPFHGFEYAMYRKICEAEIAIGKTRAADVAPVRRGRGLCVDTDTEQFFLCNKCKKKEYWESDYCPHCGAKMVEEVSE